MLYLTKLWLEWVMKYSKTCMVVDVIFTIIWLLSVVVMFSYWFGMLKSVSTGKEEYNEK